MKSKGNIYLIGFSGTGKSLSGVKAAELLRLPFVDMDDLIEYRKGKPISQIFEDDGEEKFRDIETSLLRELSEKTSRVVSTGGGVPVRIGNREVMHSSGMIILLTATPKTIHQRLTARENRSRILRPLLGDDAPELRVAKLLNERADAYSCADRIIDTEGLSHNQVAEAIRDAWIESQANGIEPERSADV